MGDGEAQAVVAPHADMRGDATIATLQQPCRYITRPATTNESIQRSVGHAAMELRASRYVGITPPVVSPLEFTTLAIEGPLCGSEIQRIYVGLGSPAYANSG